MLSHKVNWEKVKELGINYNLKKTIIKKEKKTKLKYKRNQYNYRYIWCGGQLLKFNIKNKTYSNY